MLRVMLVDDEPYALKGLELLIDWHAEGFEICAQCTDGEEALKQIPLSNPDLIVTDIRMPGMDGLQLMQAAQRAGYSGQFVVVSGHNEFAYAKRALDLGVAGYLLKPVEPTEAAEVLEHVRRRLMAREESTAKDRETFGSALHALLAENGKPISGIPQGCTWRLAAWGAPLPYAAAQAVVAAFPGSAAAACIIEDKEVLALRWPSGEDEPDWNEAEGILKRYHRKFTFSECTGDTRELPLLLKQLAALLDASGRALTERVMALCRAVALRQPEDCRERCADLEIFCAACGAGTQARAKQQLITELSNQLAERPEQFAAILAAQDTPFEPLCMLAIRLLAPVQKRLSDQVMSYSREHSEERLTMESIAAALSYNPTYLGRVFKEEQGIGFGQWLANERLERAAQLLCGTEENIYVIAGQVGYPQYKRFLKHFKNRYGVTPEQYRKQQK